MDIDHIRAMVRDEEFVQSEHFQEQSDQRRILLEQVLEAIENGRIIQEFPKRSPYPECIIEGTVQQEIAGISIERPLYVQVAVGEQIIFITADWNPPRELGQKRRRR